MTKIELTTKEKKTLSFIDDQGNLRGPFKSEKEVIEAKNMFTSYQKRVATRGFVNIT